MGTGARLRRAGCCLLALWTLAPVPVLGSGTSLKLKRVGVGGQQDQAEVLVLRELEFIRRRYDEARQLLASDTETTGDDPVIRRALRLLEANVRHWEAVEPRARGSQTYEDALLLVAKNRATIGHAYARMGELELALEELETACPTLWELQRTRKRSTSQRYRGGRAEQSSVLAPSQTEQIVLKSSPASPAAQDGLEAADGWLPCYATLANIYTETQTRQEASSSDMFNNLPWISNAAGSGKRESLSQHAVKLQTLAMISKLSVLSQGENQQISVSRRVVWGEAKAMRTHLNEIVRQLITVNTPEEAKALFEKAQRWIQVTEADTRRILDSLSQQQQQNHQQLKEGQEERKRQSSESDPDAARYEDLEESARISAAAAMEASAAERALLLGELKREGAHYLGVLEGVITEGWAYLDQEIKRATEQQPYHRTGHVGATPATSEGFQSRLDVLRAFRAIVLGLDGSSSPPPSSRSELRDDKADAAPSKQQQKDEQAATDSSELPPIVVTVMAGLLIAVLAGWVSPFRSSRRSRRTATVLAATRRQQQQQQQQQEASAHNRALADEDLDYESWDLKVARHVQDLLIAIRRFRAAIKRRKDNLSARWARYVKRRNARKAAAVAPPVVKPQRAPSPTRAHETNKPNKGSRVKKQQNRDVKPASEATKVVGKKGKAAEAAQVVKEAAVEPTTATVAVTATTATVSDASCPIPVQPQAQSPLEVPRVAAANAAPAPATEDVHAEPVRSIKGLDEKAEQARREDDEAMEVLASAITSQDSSEAPATEQGAGQTSAKEEREVRDSVIDAPGHEEAKVGMSVYDGPSPIGVRREEEDEGRTTDEGTDEDVVDDEEEHVDTRAHMPTTDAVAIAESKHEPAAAVPTRMEGDKGQRAGESTAQQLDEAPAPTPTATPTPTQQQKQVSLVEEQKVAQSSTAGQSSSGKKQQRQRGGEKGKRGAQAPREQQAAQHQKARTEESQQHKRPPRGSPVALPSSPPQQPQPQPQPQSQQHPHPHPQAQPQIQPPYQEPPPGHVYHHPPPPHPLHQHMHMPPQQAPMPLPPPQMHVMRPGGEASVPMPPSSGIPTAVMPVMSDPSPFGMRISVPGQGPPPPPMVMNPHAHAHGHPPPPPPPLPVSPHMPIPNGPPYGATPYGHSSMSPFPSPTGPQSPMSPAYHMPPDWLYRSMSASPPFYPPPPSPSSNRENVEAAIKGQIEYYFSVENLCKDLYLRSKMDDDGFVSLAEIANFNRMKRLTSDLRLIVSSIQASDRVEVQMPWALRALGKGNGSGSGGVEGQGPHSVDPAHLQTLYASCRVRTREHPERWVQQRRADAAQRLMQMQQQQQAPQQAQQEQ